MSEHPSSASAALRAVLGEPRHAEALRSGAAWRRVCQVLSDAEHLVTGPHVPDDDRHRAEGYRYLARFLAAGLRSCVTHDDPDDPVLHRMIDDRTPWGLDHPDCLYLYAALRGDRSYTLSGRRGTANVLDIQINAGHFSAGRVDAVSTLASVDGSDLDVASDGSFTLQIGPQAPEVGGLRVGADARFLHVRQYFADWDREEPAELYFACVDAGLPRPAPRPELVGRQLDTLADWIERAGAQWEGLSRHLLSQPENSMVVHGAVGMEAQGALAGQVYGMGNFACAPDEAVVLSFEPPRCVHWNVSLADWYWQAIDYATRQSSLNHRQARKDTDGRVRCVVAHADPGVTNWLDCGGLDRGSLVLRLHRAAARPEVRLERVALSALEGQLPADTPRVTPAERGAVLARRQRAVRRRYAD